MIPCEYKLRRKRSSNIKRTSIELMYIKQFLHTSFKYIHHMHIRSKVCMYMGKNKCWWWKCELKLVEVRGNLTNHKS